MTECKKRAFTKTGKYKMPRAAAAGQMMSYSVMTGVHFDSYERLMAFIDSVH